MAVGPLDPAAVGLDQRPIQADEGPAFLQSLLQDLVQGRGPVRDDIDGFVQVPVGGGDADARIPRQCVQVGVFLEPSQGENDSFPRGGRSLSGAGVMGLAVDGQPAGYGGQSLVWNVQGGTIGNHVESCRKCCFVVKINHSLTGLACFDATRRFPQALVALAGSW